MAYLSPRVLRPAYYELDTLISRQTEHDACGVGFVFEPIASHENVQAGQDGLANLHHRGTEVSGKEVGDGAGKMTEVPELFLRETLGPDVLAGLGNPDRLAVGQFFFSRTDDGKYSKAKELAEQQVKDFLRKNGYREDQFTWREVPLGPNNDKTWPRVEQLIIPRKANDEKSEEAYERGLYFLRQSIEAEWRKAELNASNSEDAYVCSLSGRMIVYKGLAKGKFHSLLFPDLKNPRYISRITIVHERFSTNTSSTPDKAHPYRWASHNGEINTVLGNIIYFRSRMKKIIRKIAELIPDRAQAEECIAKIENLIQPGNSDTGTFDNIIEALVLGGLSLPTAMSVMIPSAYGHKKRNYETIKYASQDISIPWDGPATMVVCDGNYLVVARDRSGFRPFRVVVTRDGKVYGGSEIGMCAPENIVRTISIGPGDTIAINLKTNQILTPSQVEAMAAKELAPIANEVKSRYRARSKKSVYKELPPVLPPINKKKLFVEQARAHYTQESLEDALDVMAGTGNEATGSMGDDSAPAFLEQNRALNFFYQMMRQQFAQVTNPPTDSVNESASMSTSISLGSKFGMTLPSPYLLTSELEKLEHENSEDFYRISAIYTYSKRNRNPKALEEALDSIRADVERQVRAGKTQIIISQERKHANELAIPMPLVVSAVYSHLANLQLLEDVAIHAHTEDLIGTHELAMLTTVGAKTVSSRVTEETIAARVRSGKYDLHSSFRKLDEAQKYALAIKNHRKALNKGLKKVMSKIGISPFESFQGGYNFNFLGLSNTVVAKYFAVGTSMPASPIGGLTLNGIQTRQIRFAERANKRIQRAELRGTMSEVGLARGTTYRALKPQNAIAAEIPEDHVWTPEVVELIQHAAKFKSQQHYDRLVSFSEQKRLRTPTVLRNLLDIKYAADNDNVQLDDVEAVEYVLDRFRSPSISLGALGPPVHRDIAIAMNNMRRKSKTGAGPISGSGEGGEPVTRRFGNLSSQFESASSGVKQIASARFGVDAAYLNDAIEIEIKMAQGAKPGEGGALAGNKVVGLVAEVRHATPGVGLVSPPPHHDIYSIEDLAQLIYDLKQVNPNARICVKLVAQPGIGQIAVGVVKAGADKILISGNVGGTGNAPQTSITNAGFPWEIGLAEVQQALEKNNLRDRVILGTDGGLITGRDIVTAALLGAQEFGLGTSSLVALGCLMVKKCHTGKCPAGLTTQDPEFLKLYSGNPEHLENYFHFVAEEVRTILAKLGFKRLEDIIGRTDLLRSVDLAELYKAAGVRASSIDENDTNLSPLLNRAGIVGTAVATKLAPGERNPVDDTLDQELNPEDIIRRLRAGETVTKNVKIQTSHRSVGAHLAGCIAREFILNEIDVCRAKLKSDIEHRLGRTLEERDLTEPEQEMANEMLEAATREFQSRPAPLNDNALTLNFTGYAGQSFGAFTSQGMNLILRSDDTSGGDGNDYVGKGMSGGKIVIMARSGGIREIVGNTVLYGATGGRAFFAGKAKERFAVRNSGAMAVVEGCGDHGCEYATGGTAVVLGNIGRNFGGGMKGGLAFVYDPQNTAHKFANLDDVVYGKITDEAFTGRFLNETDKPDAFEAELYKLVEQHAKETGSRKAWFIVKNWNVAKKNFTMFVPKEVVALREEKANREKYDTTIVNYMRPNQVVAVVKNAQAALAA